MSSPAITPLVADDEFATLRQLETRGCGCQPPSFTIPTEGDPPGLAGAKDDGHQAPSASMVRLVTAQPHASPVRHVINDLLGLLDTSIELVCADLEPYKAIQAASRTRIRWTTSPAQLA